MTQIELNINELFALESEISGVMYQDQVLLKGLLSQDLPYVQKFRLEDIVSQVTPQKERLNKLREELIEQYGEEVNGQRIIKEFLDSESDEQKEVNPGFIKANEAMKEFLEMEIALNVYAFRESDFNFKGTEYYPVFNKLVRKIKEQAMAVA